MRALVAFAISLYLLLLVVANFRPCQEWLGRAASAVLTERLGAEVEVRRVEIGLFNRVILNKVRLLDKQKRELLRAGVLSGKIELRSLLRKQLVVRAVTLLDADIHAYKRRAGEETNFQFVIDAFKGKDDQPAKPLNLRVNSVILRRVNLAYDQWDAPRTPGLFNPRHLRVRDIDGNISLKSVSAEGVRLRVRTLTLSEQCGTRVKRLCFNAEANRRRAELSRFEMELPHSGVALPLIMLRYNAAGGWADALKTFRCEGRVENARLSSEDLRHLTRLPAGLRFDLRLSTRFALTPTSLALRSLTASEKRSGAAVRLSAYLEKTGAGLRRASVELRSLNVPRGTLYPLTAPFLKKASIAQILNNLGTVNLQGNGTYLPQGESRFALFAETEAGRLSAEAAGRMDDFRFSLKTAEASPARLLSTPELPSMLTLTADGRVRLRGKSLESLGGKVTLAQALYKGYRYHGITAEGEYIPQQVRWRVESADDPHLRLAARGELRLNGGEPAAARLWTAVENFAPAALGLNTPYGSARLRGTLSADFPSLRPGAPQGTLELREAALTGGKSGDYRLERFSAALSGMGNDGRLVVRSDFLDAELHGMLSPEKLVAGLEAMVWRSLPGLWRRPAGAGAGCWRVAARLKRTDALRALLGADIDIAGAAVLQGTLDTGAGNTSLTLHCPAVSFGGQELGETSLYLHGSGTRYECLAQTEKLFAGKPHKLELSLFTADSLLHAAAGWSGAEAGRAGGAVRTTTRFFPGGAGTVDFQTSIHPTSFALGDSVWQISSGEIAMRNRNVRFSNVRLAHEDQSLTIDGRLSPARNDSIVARLNRIDVNYLLSLVNFDAVSFGGGATGDAVFTNTPGHPQLHARLRIPDFTFNDGSLGDALILGHWDAEEGSIHLDANMRTDSLGHGTEVTGFVSPKNKNLRLNIKAKDTRLLFLRRYMDGIFSGFDGNATGDVCLYGPFKQLDFSGEVTARARAGIDATGVDYRIDGGKVLFRPGAFVFEDFDLHDNRGGKGKANGSLLHTHLKNLRYGFDLTASRMLCYDRAKNPDLPFHCTAIATGGVRLHGQPGYFQADMNITPESGSTLVYELGDNTTAAESDFVRFGEKRRPAAADGRPRDSLAAEGGVAARTETGGTDIVLNFVVDANPSLLVKVVTDQRAGDYLAVNGTGPIRASFHNKGSFDMYGRYSVVRGEYRLSLQEVIRKRLTLQPGGSITFSGRPMLADLNLKALYTLNGVPLSDLNYGAGFGQKTVKADCILNIGGQAAAPQISFDLDLHNISDEEKQMVRQLIATDEDMSRQVIYLLGIGRFYTANNGAGGQQTYTAQQQSGAAMRSFLSSTLTGQLNSAIASALGSKSHWSFGANVAPGMVGWTDLEVDGLLQGRLFNDRLLVNSNFGYRDRPTYSSNFVGDFDIQYLLTPKGSVSLKAYSETTDRYFTKSSLTTQGIGIALKRDFSNLRDLFKPQYTRRRK